MSETAKITIRDAVESDLDDVHQMLCELITYEKLPCAAMDKSMFKQDSGLTTGQPHAYFYIFVAETVDHHLAGYALYLFQYRTNQGKFVTLEDLFVRDEYRGSGVGRRFLQELADVSLRHQALGIKFSCLKWNSACKFYERCGAVWNGVQVYDWIEYKITGDAIQRLHEM